MPGPGGAKEVLPALEYLAHPVATLPLDADSLPAAAAKELVVVDATRDLSRAQALCRSLRGAAEHLAILVVMPEVGLAGLQRDWGASDFVLPGAGPAEVEARLRLLTQRPVVAAAAQAAAEGLGAGQVAGGVDHHQLLGRGGGQAVGVEGQGGHRVRQVLQGREDLLRPPGPAGQAGELGHPISSEAGMCADASVEYARTRKRRACHGPHLSVCDARYSTDALHAVDGRALP